MNTTQLHVKISVIIQRLINSRDNRLAAEIYYHKTKSPRDLQTMKIAQTEYDNNFDSVVLELAELVEKGF